MPTGRACASKANFPCESVNFSATSIDAVFGEHGDCNAGRCRTAADLQGALQGRQHGLTAGDRE